MFCHLLLALLPRAPLSPAVRHSSRSPDVLLQAQTGGSDEDWRSFRARLVRTHGDREHTQLQADDQAPGAAPQEAEDAAPSADPFWAHQIPGVEPGCLLVTRPNVVFVGRPMLQKAVVLVLDHGPGGTIGLALNRPTNNKLRSVLDDHSELREPLGGQELQLGGTSVEEPGQTSALAPSDPGAANLWMLSSREGVPGESGVLPGISLAPANEAARLVRQGDAERDDFTFFAGHFHWPADALQEEHEAGAWLCASLSAAAVRTFVGGDETPQDRWERALSLLGVPNELEDDLDAALGDLGDEITGGSRVEGADAAAAEAGERRGRGGVAQRPHSAAEMKAELGEALQLWLDALDGELELEAVLRRSHELFGGEELGCEAWRRLDVLTAEVSALAHAPSSREPWLSPWLQSLGRALPGGVGGRAPCASPRFALHALRLALTQLTRGGEALLDEYAPHDVRQVSLVHALAGEAEAGAGAISRIGVLPLALLALILARRLGLEATVADSDGAGLLLRVECDASEDSSLSALGDGALGDGGGTSTPESPLDGVLVGGGLPYDRPGAIGSAPREAADSSLWGGYLPLSETCPGEGRAPESAEGAMSGAALYLGLEQGCVGRLFEERELLDLGTPGSALILQERVSLAHAREFTSEIPLVKLLVELTTCWAKHFEVTEQQPPSAYWSVQSMLLQRLTEKNITQAEPLGANQANKGGAEQPREVVRPAFEFPAIPGYSKPEDTGFGNLFGL